MLPRLLCFVSVLMVTVATAQSREVKVFAAASLSDALGDVATAFSVHSHHRLKLVLAGSSILARQIEAGADADIFLSADEAWVDYLAERKLVDGASRRVLLTNNLVLAVSKERTISIAIDAGGQWLAKIGDGRIAVGDPAHVPVGKYARSALKSLGTWERVRGRIATALDTRAALALVERGEAVAGIVYATDVKASSGVKVAARFPKLEGPKIAYPIVRLSKAADDATDAALKFIKSSKAGEIFQYHGFGLE